MSYFDAYAEKSQLLGPHGELVSRLTDFFDNKSRLVPERLESFRHLIETKVRSVDLRESLRAFLEQLRKRASLRQRDPTEDPVVDEEWQRLVVEIQAFGQKETIENYTEYCFSIEFGDGF